MQPRRDTITLKRCRALIAAMLLLGCDSTRPSRTAWHVRPDGAGDARTIQDAVDRAQPGDEIVLAPGTYTWTTQQPTSGGLVNLRSDITLRGAGPESTFLDAEQQGPVVVCEPNAAYRFADLTLRSGRGNPGAGIVALGADVELDNCWLLNNSGGRGTALTCNSAKLNQCVIRSNESREGGPGAIRCSQRLSIANTLVEGNSSWQLDATAVGAIWCPELVADNCVFLNNSATAIWGGSGGAITFGEGRIQGSLFQGNFAGANAGNISPSRGTGGAIDWHATGSGEITECIFVENIAKADAVPGKGGAIASDAREPKGSLRVTACTFIGNKSLGSTMYEAVRSAGIDIPNGVVSRCLFVEQGGRALTRVEAQCSTFFANGEGDEDAVGLGSHNFLGDPLFCSAAPSEAGAFSLRSDSPCLPGQHPDGADCGLIGASTQGCSP